MASKFNQLLSPDCYKLAKKGNPDALTEIYATFSKAIYNLCRRILENEAAASDVTQDVLLKVFDKLDDCKDKNAVGGWIRQITVNESFKWLRVKKGLPPVMLEDEPSDEPSPEVTLSMVQTNCDLEKILNQLSLHARTVLWLHEVEELKHHEIAAICGYSVSFSKMTLSRALSKLRELIELNEQAERNEQTESM